MQTGHITATKPPTTSVKYMYQTNRPRSSEKLMPSLILPPITQHSSAPFCCWCLLWMCR